jgi:hypothetical protein
MSTILQECSGCDREFADLEDDNRHPCVECESWELTAKECIEWYGVCESCSRLNS